MGKIYILEDDKNISEIEQFALKNAGYEVSAFATASDFENALTKGQEEHVMAVLDKRTSGFDNYGYNVT